MSSSDHTPEPTAESTEVLDAVENSSTQDTDVDTDTDLAAATTDEESDGPRHAGPRRRRTVALASGIAAVLVLGGAGMAVAAAHKTVDVDVDGQIVQVSTFAGDVGYLLEQQGITVGEHDLVVPGLDEPLTEGGEVVVRTAEQIDVTVDGEATQIWTVDDTAADALASLQASGRDAEITASRTSGRQALDLPLVANGPVTFVVDGEERTTEIDGVADLATAMLAAEITVDANDQVTVATDSSGTPVVTIVRVALEEDSRTESIDFDTVERGTDDLYEGESRVVSEGSEGERTYVYVSRVVDGEVVSSRLVSSKVTTKPQDRVVEHGTAERPAPPPAPAASSSDEGDDGDSGGSGGGGGTVSGDVWAQLAQCESGGNPTTNTGNGYYGLYQFSLPTWQAMGGSGLPSEASAAEQTQRAQALQARSGWGQWPACAAKLGLL